jgi:tRNA pseudouridine38-40 synthase
MTNLTRWKFTIEYDGTPFSGWQRQDKVPSVQKSIETAIKKFSGQNITIHVTGRTDAGVHARGQVAHADFAPLSKPLSPFEIAKAINAHLKPEPVSIIRAEIVSEDFHARFSAKNKLYVYRILNRPTPPALERTQIWHVAKTLDIETMRAGAKHLIGQHDFSTFRDSECQAKSPVKTIDRLEITSRTYDDCGGREIRIEVEGRSFLHHQVRNMAGTLKLVGEGKWTPEDVRTALEARDRTRGGPTAPARGLCLMRVDY